MSRANVLRVFVASPNDVLDARKVLEEVIDDLNFSWSKRSGLLLELLDWRTHVTPYLDKPPQTALIDQLPVETWDLFIGILWSRFGTPIYETNPDTGQKYQSGTEHEFNLAYKCYKSRGQPKILFYRCTKPISPDSDLEQPKLVQEFFKQFQVDGQNHGLYASYENLDEFRRNLLRHLTDALFGFQQGIDFRPLMGELGPGIQRWIEQVNLLGNPFRYPNAGLDDKLTYYHHYPSDSELNELVGNTTEPPQSYVIVGDYGMGKTTIRQMITHVSKQRPGGRNVFSVLYTDFSALLEKLALNGSLSPSNHVDQIIVAGLKTLNIVLREGAAQISNSVSNEERRNLLHYVNKYQNKLRETERKTIIDSIGIVSESLHSEELSDSYKEMFYGFCRSIRIYGYDIVYILMDQLDESGIADDGKIIELLTPLLSDRHLMEAPDALAIFRIFLPAHINTLMRID